MGGSAGQSTTTVDKWPDFLSEPGSYVRWTTVPLAGGGEIRIPVTMNTLTPVIPMGYLDRAKTESDALKGVNFFSIAMITDQAVEEIDAIARLAARGRNGNVTISKAKDHLTEILDGDHLEGSAAFLTAVGKADTKADDAFTDDVSVKLGATPFVIGDPDPSNLAQSLSSTTSAKYRARMAAEMQAKNYQFERGIQSGAVPLGIDFAAEEVNDAEMVRRAGLYDREYRQSVLEDNYRKVIEKDSNAVRTLEVLGNAVRTLVGAQEAHTTPYYRPSPLMGAVGGAITGGAVGGVPGAVVGGVLGLASSL